MTTKTQDKCKVICDRIYMMKQDGFSETRETGRTKIKNFALKKSYRSCLSCQKIKLCTRLGPRREKLDYGECV